MDISIFTDKTELPDETKLSAALDPLYNVWVQIRSYVKQAYPGVVEEWNFPGTKYGWNFRMKDKKRAIIYLLPRDKYFMVAFVYGEKAATAALGSDISPDLKNIISSAKVYAEGRGFRIEIRNDEKLDDLKKLIEIKISH